MKNNETKSQTSLPENERHGRTDSRNAIDYLSAKQLTLLSNSCLSNVPKLNGKWPPQPNQNVYRNSCHSANTKHVSNGFSSITTTSPNNFELAASTRTNFTFPALKSPAELFAGLSSPGSAQQLKTLSLRVEKCPFLIPSHYAKFFDACCRGDDSYYSMTSSGANDPSGANGLCSDRRPNTALVYQLLKSSALPNDVLGVVWATVNKTYPGQLTRVEFYAALALVALAQKTGKIFGLDALDRLQALPIPQFFTHRPTDLPNVNDLRVNSINEPEENDDFTEFQSAETPVVAPNCWPNKVETQNLRLNNNNIDIPPYQRTYSDNGQKTDSSPDLPDHADHGPKTLNLVSNSYDECQNRRSSAFIGKHEVNLMSPELDSNSASSEVNSMNSREPSLRSLDLRSVKCADLENIDSAGSNAECEQTVALATSSQASAPHLIGNCAMLYDKYSAFREIESIPKFEDHSYMLEKFVKYCRDALSEGSEIFKSMKDAELSSAVAATDKGAKYLECLTEIYAICKRMHLAAKTYGFLTESLGQLIKDSDFYWYLLEPVASCLNMNFDLELNFESDITPCTDCSIASNRTNSCGICLLSVNSANRNSKQCKLSSKFISYGGRNYHAPCANFWLNRMDDLLPRMEIPGLLG